MKAGWQSLRFSDLGRVFNGNSISEADKKKYFAGQVEGLPYIATKDVGFDHSVNYESGVRIPEGRQRDFKLAPANTVLVCAEGGSAGRKIAHLDEPVSFGNKLFAISPSHPHSSRFVFYYCLSDAFSKQFRAAMAGLIGGVSINKFKELTIQLPAATEQQRIVIILDEAFEAIATARVNAEKNLQNTRALFESNLQSVFTDRGEGWVETTLGNEIDLLVGFAFKSAKYSANESDVSLLRGDNIVQGSLRWDDVKRWPKNDTAAYDRYWLRENDVVLAMDRPWVKAGLKHSIITADDLPCLLVQRTASLRCKSNLTSRFLLYLVRSNAFIQHILGVQTGIGVPHISGQQIKDFVFLRPPTTEQKRIAANLDRLLDETQRLESLCKQKPIALDDLNKSLLHQAFSGAL